MAKRNNPETATVSIAKLSETIHSIRGERVMLDADLAELYGIETKVLLQAVKRNLGRFPPDFMFQLTKQEFNDLRSQIVTSKSGGRRYPPYAFSEHGVAMLSSVLRSPQAIAVDIEIVRAFVRMRQLSFANEELARKIDELDRRVSKHDKAIAEIIEAIRQLMAPPSPKETRPIGFAPWEDKP
jgi:hypothetical protein